MARKVQYHLSGPQRLFSPLLCNRLVRNLILLPETLSGTRASNKPEDYKLFRKARVQAIGRVAIDVSDLERSIQWYARVPQFRFSGSRYKVADPAESGARLDIAYFDVGTQRESLVLVQRTAADGCVRIPTLKGFFHVAFQMSKGATAFSFAERMRAIGIVIAYGPVAHHSGPGGDGESGGNKAVYIADPDGTWLEFFHDMDSIKRQDHWSAAPHAAPVAV